LRYIAQGMKKLIYTQTHTEVQIWGIGQAINKAVSVAEVVARSQKAQLDTIIFEVQEIDVWESIKGDLDNIEVTRNLPGILLTVRLNVLS
jgi:DNA-binding protein